MADWIRRQPRWIPRSKLHVQTLLNRLEQIHNQVMRDVETAEREHVLVFRLLVFDQFNIQSLLLEETFFDRAENRCFASDTDVSDTDFPPDFLPEMSSQSLLHPTVRSTALSATIGLKKDMVQYW